MPGTDFVSIINAIEKSIGTPYPTVITPPVESTAFDSLSNFLRNTPTRKVFLVNHSGGDYEYDENMSIEQEIDLDIANNALFLALRSEMEMDFGVAGNDTPAGILLMETNPDDCSKEGQIFDDIEWTPEYEGGAIFSNTDSFETCYWIIDKEILLLQKGKWTGDGNFIQYVLVTITPL